MAILRRLIIPFALCAAIIASPLIERQTTTTAATTTNTNGPPTEMTVSGKVATIAVPTAAGSVSATSTSEVLQTKTTASDPTSTTISEGAPGVPEDTATACKNTISQPICQPHEGQELQISNNYWFQWSPTAFQQFGNATIRVGLQDNNNTAQLVWLSDSLPTYQGLTNVTIQGQWLDGWKSKNFSVVWTASSTNMPGQKHAIYNVTLGEKPVEHLPAPPATKLPTKESLTIALPIVLVALCLMVFGLLFGMRKHRHIGIGSIMGRRKGYGTGKSKRQRLGMKKGAIRLEDRENATVAPRRHQQYHDDDAISPALRQNSQVSLGSLVTDDEPNAFRREVEKQKMGK